MVEETPHNVLSKQDMRRRILRYTLGGAVVGFCSGVGWIAFRRIKVYKTLADSTIKGTLLGFTYGGYSNFLDTRWDMPVTSFSNSALSGSITGGLYGLLAMSPQSAIAGVVAGGFMGLVVNVCVKMYYLSSEEGSKRREARLKAIQDHTNGVTAPASTAFGTVTSLEWFPIHKSTPQELKFEEIRKKIEAEAELERAKEVERKMKLKSSSP